MNLFARKEPTGWEKITEQIDFALLLHIIIGIILADLIITILPYFLGITIIVLVCMYIFNIKLSEIKNRNN